MWHDTRMADLPSDLTVPDKTGFPPGGYALADAPRAFVDPELWEDFERAADAAGGLLGTYGVFFLGGEPVPGWEVYRKAQHINVLIAERARTQARVKKSFMSQLRAGDLIAMGLLVPLRPDTVPVQIPGDHWWVLVPDYQNPTAKGAGAEYVRIQVYRRQDLEQRAVESPSSEEQGPDPEKFRRRKPHGRPSCMPLIKTELCRRGKKGKLLTPKTAEFEFLAAWAKSHCQDVDPPSKAWIQKRLGKVYDKLIRRK